MLDTIKLHLMLIAPLLSMPHIYLAFCHDIMYICVFHLGNRYVFMLFIWWKPLLPLGAALFHPPVFHREDANPITPCLRSQPLAYNPDMANHYISFL